MADFHVHTTLKPYLFARSLWRETRAPRRFSPFSFRSGLPALLRGGVRTAVVAHPVPEEALFRDSLLVRAAGRREESRGLHYTESHPHRDSESYLHDTVLAP